MAIDIHRRSARAVRMVLEHQDSCETQAAAIAAVDPLYHRRQRQMRRDRYKHMHVVARQHAFLNPFGSRQLILKDVFEEFSEVRHQKITKRVSHEPIMQNATHIPKQQIPVRMSLVDGTSAFGVVHVRQAQRILDMLIDSRTFFPMMSNSGTSLINKNNVVKINVLTLDEIMEKKELFPELNFKYLESNNW